MAERSGSPGTVDGAAAEPSRPHAVEVAAALRNPLAPAAGKSRPLPAAVLDRHLEHAAGARRRPRPPCRPRTGVRAIIVLELCMDNPYTIDSRYCRSGYKLVSEIQSRV